MIFTKKSYSMLLLLTAFSSLNFTKSQKPVESSTRGMSHQHGNIISDHAEELIDMEHKMKGLYNCSLTLYTMVLNNLMNRMIIFESDITIDTGHIFKLLSPSNAAVFSPSNPISIFASEHVGIDKSFDKNLQLRQGNTRINSHTFITGTLTVNDDFIVEGNLVVNGAVFVAPGKSLHVLGNVTLDGLCASTLINNGAITATGSIILQNYNSTSNSTSSFVNKGSISTTTKDISLLNNKSNGDDSITIENIGMISTTSGNIVIEHNEATGVNGTTLHNKGIIITDSGNVTIQYNFGQRRVLYNATYACVSTRKTGALHISNNNSLGEVLCNNNSAFIDTEDGHLFVESNHGEAGVLINLNSGRIESFGKGSLFIKNNTSGATTILNAGSTNTVIKAHIGDIKIQNNQGLSAAVHNCNGAKITTTTFGSLWLTDNHASGATGILNDLQATIETALAGNIHIERNSGEMTGVRNDNEARIISSNNLLFHGNVSRNGTAVLNRNGGAIQAKEANSAITFSHNIGKVYGVRNAVEGGSNDTEIRTINSATGDTRIQFIGNSGALADTHNETTGGTGGAHIVAGATTGTTGNGAVCYDAQQVISSAGSTVTNPTAQLCTV